MLKFLRSRAGESVEVDELLCNVARVLGRHDPGGRKAARKILQDTFSCVKIHNGRYEIPENVVQNK